VAEASELRAIVAVAERLNRELELEAAAEVADTASPAGLQQEGWWQPTDDKEARLASRLSQALARLAMAAQADASPDEIVEDTVRAALARTEVAMRGELMRGDVAALREQLPGFVFLVVLPGAGMDRALELADRARALLTDTLP
jgi:hypothetical protein